MKKHVVVLSILFLATSFSSFAAQDVPGPQHGGRDNLHCDRDKLCVQIDREGCGFECKAGYLCWEKDGYGGERVSHHRDSDAQCCFDNGSTISCSDNYYKVEKRYDGRDRDDYEDKK